MKKILLFLPIFFVIKVYSQDTDRKTDFAFSPEVIAQGQIFGGANVTIVKVLIGYGVVVIEGTRIGLETNFRKNSEFMIAPKIGYEFCATVFVLRLTGITYFQNKETEFRILPEVGLS